jgi:hypothetical protein
MRTIDVRASAKAGTFRIIIEIDERQTRVIDRELY